MIKDKIIKRTTCKEEFPTLMKHKSGSIFFVSKCGLGYNMMCLCKGIKKETGDFGIGAIVKTKDLKEFKRMKSGFFIEMVIE
jgi:hypothetical protein